MTRALPVDHFLETRTRLLAMDLIARGMRPTLVSAVLPIAPRVTNDMYKYRFGRSASSGQVPSSALHYMGRSDAYNLLAPMIAMNYSLTVETATNSVCAVALASTHDFSRRSISDDARFSDLLKPRPSRTPTHGHVDISGTLIEFCYFVIRDMSIELASLHRCSNCGTPYLYHTQVRHTSTYRLYCPWCKVEHGPQFRTH